MRHILIAAFVLIASPAFAQTIGKDQQPGQHFDIRAENLPLATQGPPAPYVDNAPVRVPRGDHMPIVPNGFTVTLFAEGLPHPRRIEVMPDGTVIVVQQGTGMVLLARDSDGDGKADRGGVVLEKLQEPFGIALKPDGDFLISDPLSIWNVPVATGGDALTRVTAPDAFGPPQGHITRPFVLDTDGGIYVAVGSMANLAEEDAPKATIQHFAADGSGQATFARGLRNATGLRFEPHTGDLYAVVMERDTMGDDLVPDFFTRVEEGDDFGWPYQYAGGFAQPGFNTNPSVKRAAAKLPDVLFEAHSAPMDLIFLPDSWPEDYRGDAVVALKGSSNREVPTGYKLVTIPFGPDHRPTGGYDNFLTGLWIAGDGPAQVWARPAALALMPDGSLLVADDFAGHILKITPPKPE